MNYSLFFIITALLLTTLSPGKIQAQTTGDANANTVAIPVTATTDTTASSLVLDQPLKADAGPDKNVAIGRTVVFDGSASTGPANQPLIYTWDFGDGATTPGINASHIYNEAGTYKVKLSVSDGTKTSTSSIVVSVAKTIVLLIADHTAPKPAVKQLKQYAEHNNVLLSVIRPKNESLPSYTISQNIAEQIVAADNDFTQAPIVIVWTESTIGLNALSDVSRILANTISSTAHPSNPFQQKIVLRVEATQASPALARLAQTTFNTIKPNFILLTTTAALNFVLAQPDTTQLLANLKTQHITYQIIGTNSERALDQISWNNFLSYDINYLINQGVSQDTLFLLLMLPVVATIIALARQVVGVQAFGIYVPSIITLTFVTTRLKDGLILFGVLLLTATLARIGLRYLRLLYLPRMAIVLSIVSLSMFIVLTIAAYFHHTNFLTLSIFPILVMTILTEKFVEAQIEQGNKAAIILTAETLILAVISYLIISWDSFQTFILAYPEVILATILFNILLGRFTGLRLSEVLRFRKLLKKDLA